MLWHQMWPNIFAPGFWTVLGIALSHWHLRRHISSKNEELKGHLKPVADATRRMIADLHQEVAGYRHPDSPPEDSN